MTDILTVEDVAGLLKTSKSQVYELTEERTRSGDLGDHSLPCVRIGRSVRFRRSDVEAWIERIASK